MADIAGAKAAIRAYLAAHWSGAAVIWPNGPPPVTQDANGDPVPYVYGEINIVAAGIRGVGKPGAHVVIDDGLISLHVFVPSGDGTADADAMAGALGEVFRVKQFYDTEPGACVRTWTPRVGDGEPNADNGMRYRVTVSIPFEFWHRA